MVRLDMSEYMEKHSVARLIGAPPGYVGYDEGGFLTETVRRRPYSVLLFDEIEKAHPDVFNILLQVLDDGRMTDGHGRTVDFRNTIIIMTSNVGSRFLQDAGSGGGFSKEELDQGVSRALKEVFRPEFLNRIDEIITFHALDREHIGHIAGIQMRHLNRRLSDRGLTIELDDAAMGYLAKKGYDPSFGARPLKRVIQREIENPLSLSLLKGEFVKGETIRFTVDDTGQGLVFGH